MAIAAFVGIRYGREWLTPAHNDVIWYLVKKEPLEVTVVEKGTFEAARNEDLKCLVKATRGGQFATTIRWIVDDGTQVMTNRPEDLRSNVRGDWVWPHRGKIPRNARAGKPATKEELANPQTAKAFDELKVWSDLLTELDKSGLEDQKLTQLIAVKKAESDVVGAKAQKDIDESQNKSDELDAKLKAELAKIDFDKYVQCEFDLLKADLEGQKEQANDKSVWSRRMSAKGYVSFSQAEADRLALEKLQGSNRLLNDFTKAREEMNLKNQWDLAKLAIERVRIQAKAKIEKADKNLEAMNKVLEQEQEKLKDLEEQIANCTFYAPRDGMALYYVSEQQRSGFGAQQSTVAQGEPVREGQTLIRIPDLDHMLVNTRVHEAMVDKVKQGMKVEIRIEAFQDRMLKASVRSIATVAMQPDWRASPDVKMYQTMVSVDEPVANLKPGMSAEVRVFVDATSKPVVAVPIQAVIGGPEMGATRKIFVKGANGLPEERDIKVGISNEKIVEIREGIQEGDEIVLNPKVLIGDKAKTRQPGDFEKKNGESNGGGDAKPGDGKPGDGKGGPNKGPGGSRGPGAGGPVAGGGGMPSAEDIKKYQEEFKKGTPQQRKAMIERMPEQLRAAAKENAKKQGLEVAD